MPGLSTVETASGVRWSVPARIVALQVLAGVALAVAALVWGVDAATEAIVGAMVAFLPNACFAWWIARAGRIAPAGAVLQAGVALGGWGLKMALVVLLLVLAIGVARMGSLAFFVGLGVVLLVSLASPLLALDGDDSRDESKTGNDSERR